MGVPKFFRYTSERYPCLNELVKQYQIPDFDNMYLDMNGIIHNCSHPDDSNPHFRITEEKIFQDIFHYLSILFQIIKPRKLFFMAIDGVAPRAKMNQQRGRRFRSAKDAEKLEEEARAKGETLPAEKRFDSNCITPGTVFMARLHEQLRFFVKEKISTDPLWSKVKVVLSGHETPGEGEHKIMDYIRWARSQPDYDPNTKHCLYGLDADLVMLGMCTHEPHFALLREEVKFGKTTQRSTSPEETNFYLLHLSLLREYLEQEFIEIKDKLPFPYDIEKVVDDWVLMGFLVGNDFIPNLPNMHISNDALPLLYKTYTTVLPTLDGYINEAGDLNLARFEVFMQELAKIDREKFQENYADLKYFEAKTGRRPNAQERKEYKPNNDDTFNVNIDDIKANKPDDELQALIDATHDMFLDDLANDEDDGYEETSDEDANFEMEFVLHKKDYYMNKLDYPHVTNEVLAGQAECYVRAIQWNLFYYYKGCPSWCWYYPHHYAPYISDIKGFRDLKIEFELGEPFKPFEQLLAVLPAASKQLLPAPFHELMTDEDSPIVHYYPIEFETDLNGKKNDWEAVVLIPFIDEANLLSAMTPCYKRLTDEELKRNTHGPVMVYNWTPKSLGPLQSPEYFPQISDLHAIEKPVWRSELDVPPGMLKRGMLPNAKRNMLFPGFPTLRHLKYTTTLKKAKVKVFDQPSRNISLFVQLIRDAPEPTKLEDVATELLGKVIWVGWPHLTKAKVISVSNEAMRYHHVDQQNNNISGPKWTTENNTGNLHRQWLSERSTIVEHNMNRLGIELGDINIIVHAVNHKGNKYIIQDNVTMVQEPQWCKVPCGYAYQAIVRDVSACIIQEDTKYSTPQEAFAPGATAILLTQGQYYGAVAKVVDADAIKSGRIKVQIREDSEPDTKMETEAQPYYATNFAGAACGISSQFLSRITGSILVVLGERHNNPTENLNKVNLGLNLKFNKKNLEVAGYTRRCKVSNQWLYSARCIELVKAFMREHPVLFDRLAHSINNDVFFESDIWPKEIGQKKPQEVQSWLRSQSHVKAARRECGSDALEQEEITALWEHLKPQLVKRQPEKRLTLHVKWNLLYKPELHEGNVQPDIKADYKIFDRVVCSSKSMTVPFGARGTVIAIMQPSDSNTVRLSDKLNSEPSYNVMFDEPFVGGMTEELFDEPRFYRMQPTTLVNISFGRKIRDESRIQDVRRNKFVPQSTPTPNILRRGEGHNSAFASYSPPADNKIPVDNKFPNTNTNINGSTKPEDQTNLLKSLLKISEGDDDKKNKTEPGQNRRYPKESYNAVPPPTSRRNPQQNWRKDRDTTNSRGPQQPFEWSNSSYKPPLLPLPTYKPAGQHPFPSYQIKPNFSGQRSQDSGFHGNQAQQDTVVQNTRVPSFPKHLPNVSASLLTPSWDKVESVPTPASVSKPAVQDSARGSTSKDKVPNPFVPLQVQTSQRRVQNTGASSSRRNEGTAEPNPVQDKPQTIRNQNNPPAENSTARERRKCKPRIAANLPFQME